MKLSKISLVYNCEIGRKTQLHVRFVGDNDNGIASVLKLDPLWSSLS
jgi:hypothetical protein